jgi:hypothetical protein
MEEKDKTTPGYYDKNGKTLRAFFSTEETPSEKIARENYGEHIIYDPYDTSFRAFAGISKPCSKKGGRFVLFVTLLQLDFSLSKKYFAGEIEGYRTHWWKSIWHNIGYVNITNKKQK